MESKSLEIENFLSQLMHRICIVDLHSKSLPRMNCWVDIDGQICKFQLQGLHEGYFI